MSKEAIEMEIRKTETLLDFYLKLSEGSDVNRRMYERTIERFRMKLAALYTKLATM